MNSSILWISPLRGARPERWKTGTGHHPCCANPCRHWGPGSTQLTSRSTAERSRRPGRRRLGFRARGQPIREGSAHDTRTTVVGGSSRPAPTSNTSGSPQRHWVRKPRVSAISSWIERPFMATIAPVGRHERHRPPEQALEGGNGTRGDDVERRRPVQVLGTPADDRHVTELQLRHDLVEERRTSQERLDQGHHEVRTGDGQDQTGQTGTGTDVAHRGTLRTRLTEHGRVEDVTFPQPRCLAGPDQPAKDALGRQQLGVALGQREAVGRENPPRLGRHGGWSRYGPGGPARPIGFT